MKPAELKGNYKCKVIVNNYVQAISAWMADNIKQNCTEIHRLNKKPQNINCPRIKVIHL